MPPLFSSCVQPWRTRDFALERAEEFVPGADELLEISKRIQNSLSQGASRLAAAEAALPSLAERIAELEVAAAAAASAVGERRLTLRQLTNEEEDLVHGALAAGVSTEMLVDWNNQPITRNDMATLRPGAWLNDEVVNFFMMLLKDRAKCDMQGPRKLPRVHFMNTQFYPKLAETAKGYDYHGSVRRWTKRENVDIFSMDLLVVPIHCHGNHWTLALVNFGEQRLEFFDSLGGSPGHVLDTLRRYLNDESMDKKQAPFNLEGWSNLVHSTSKIPRQRNSHDCGVFMCTNADFLSQGAVLDYSQEDMPYLRRRMVAQIMQRKLFES